MKYLTTLLLLELLLYFFFNEIYRRSAIQDEVDTEDDWKGLKRGDLYINSQGKKVSMVVHPRGYEEDKNSKTWLRKRRK